MSIMYMNVNVKEIIFSKNLKKQENKSCSNTQRVPMSIMYVYIRCKRNNIFKKPKKVGKYKLFEYTESPNVFSDERLQSADSAGGHDSSQHQRLSLERNIYFQITLFLFSFFFFSFFQFIQVGLCRRKSRRESQHY